MSTGGAKVKDPLLTVEVDKGGTRTNPGSWDGTILTGVWTDCVLCTVEQDSKYSLNLPLF